MKPIPLIDIREGGPIALLKQEPERSRLLIEASRNAFGMVSRLASHIALPMGDALARRWLIRTGNPYFTEIAKFSELLPLKGLLALNLSYEWGCTSGAFASESGVTLLRVLDWPFRELGRQVVVARQKGDAGEFYNVTWPGVSGIFNALAPGRFAAALNQAPMRRHRGGLIRDWAWNRVLMHRQMALPASHLLRYVFETAPDYAAAQRLLCETPIAVPVIYVLSGTKPGEGCVIERLENHAHILPLKDGIAAASNHFQSAFNGVGHGWMPRAIDSHGRLSCFHAFEQTTAHQPNFAWLKPPVLNELSRLAIASCAASGMLEVVGLEQMRPVTETLRTNVISS